MIRVVYEQADHPEIFYHIKWNSDVKCLLIGDILYVPGFEYLRAKKEIRGFDVRKLTSIKEILESITEKVETNNNFPYSLARHINTAITIREQDRSIKTQKEIQHIAKVQKLTQETIQQITTILDKTELKKGIAYYKGEQLTAEYLKTIARTHLISHGADCPELIISSGKQTAQPHNRGFGAIKEGPIIIDIFPKGSNNYYGDCTRTYILGEDEKAKRMLHAVTQAHDTCVAMCTPGRSVKEIDKTARKILYEEGFETTEEQGFIHSLGHGVGLAVHETPRVSFRSDEILKKGMVITIEPGLYYSTGVRHENIVVVEDTPIIL